MLIFSYDVAHSVSDCYYYLIILLAGGDLVHEFRGATSQYILSELERRKSELKPQLVWIGAQKEPGITSRTWKWVNGMNIHLYVQNYI